MELGEAETWIGVNLVESNLWSSWLEATELAVMF